MSTASRRPSAAPTPAGTTVGAALANVRRHCAAETKAWVLVETEDAEVTVTVRDEGSGFPPGRLDEAAAAGRLGVAQSIKGRIRDLGGSVVIPVTEVPDIVTFAMFNDPDGLLIGLMQATGGGDGAAPPSGEGAPVDWFEVLGSDAKASQAFYGKLFGWSFDNAMANYALVDTGAGRGISGGVGASSDGRVWATVYASVDDVERCLARAGELGGKREYGPMDVDDHMQTGAIRDPAGNLFGVYHHAPH